ncbi:prenyltransferase/squalene oxidase repeat-containing protein [Micromonospora echinospora]|uniref:prenyltransferase/squalene oxidase repeat-containing protein n=1 Tax=Micromonospora echinospora TaxID=1877 RepID=UPI0033E714C9
MTRVASGPAGSGEADLWCTYAAVRTLAWLGRTDAVADRAGVRACLTGRRNADGGYAWSRGMASDAWATYYCTQALAELGEAVPQADRTREWLRDTWSGEAYGMTPGQAPDVWATHFSTRTARTICGDTVPDRAALTGWLRALQSPDGGLCWTPGDAEHGDADVRACYYGVMSWREAGTGDPPPWDVPRLVAWLRRRQDRDGGFRFTEAAEVPCLWATYRATAALAALGAAPRDPAAVTSWLLGLRGGSGAFVRWAGYPVEDVWAAFCAVGTLRALGVPTALVEAPVVARIRAVACPGGYTYREASLAADALTTAAVILSNGGGDAAARTWLEGCQLPNEGGVMYMPGRGAEVRCTLWALAAGAFAGDAVGRSRIARWIVDLQNPDGGFGHWAGRGSDLVSTVSAAEILRLLGVTPRRGLDVERLLGFVRSCASGDGHAPVPGGRPTLRAGLQAHRLLAALGHPDASAVTRLLATHRVRGGGWANEGDRMPDLLSTYEAALTTDRLGLPLDGSPVARFLDSTDRDGGTAWTPLAPTGGGMLADCLGGLLRTRLSRRRRPLPALVLS